MEFDKNSFYLSCGNGCNAHFQDIDESRMAEMAKAHSGKCVASAPFVNDANAFYFKENILPITLLHPDWKTFRSAFAVDPGYVKLRVNAFNTLGQLAGEWLSSASIAETNEWDLVVSNWAILLQYSLLGKPTAKDIVRWNELAKNSNMPFMFDSEGKMRLKV